MSDARHGTNTGSESLRDDSRLALHDSGLGVEVVGVQHSLSVGQQFVRRGEPANAVARQHAHGRGLVERAT